MKHPRYEALSVVADAYGIEPETIEGWVKDAPKKLKGIRPVREMKGYARRAGETAYRLKLQNFRTDRDKHLLERLNKKWGNIALTRHGNEYQQIPQKKGTNAPFA